MNQYLYETIKAAIGHGAPCIANELNAALDSVINNSNEWIKYQAEVKRQEAAQAEQERQAAALKAQQDRDRKLNTETKAKA